MLSNRGQRAGRSTPPWGASPGLIGVTKLMAILVCCLVIVSLTIPPRDSRLPQTDNNTTFRLTSPSESSRYPFEAIANLKIAAIQPIFTATAYSSFYRFYTKYASTPPNQMVTTDLNLLNASVVNSWSWSRGLYSFLTSNAAKQYNITLGGNLSILSEIDVIQGALFAPNGTRSYDAVILGFTEYVTSEEYQAYKRFVEIDGILIMMDATNFLAEVAYYPQSNRLALIKGHSWRFNGTAAWRDVFDRWITNNTDWVGSTYWDQIGRRYSGALTVDNNPIGKALREKFGERVFTYYSGHEENRVLNLTQTSIIAHWGIFDGNPRNIVATYIHRYKNSYVIHSGVMASDVVAFDATVQYFLAQSLLFAANNKLIPPPEISFYTEPSRLAIFTSNDKGSVTINGTTYANASIADYSYGTSELQANPPEMWILDHWSTAGGVAVANSTNSRTRLVVTGPGSLTATFIPNNATPFIPHSATVTFYTSPTRAGEIECEGQRYTNGQTAGFPAKSLISCTASPAPSYRFVLWNGLVYGFSSQVTFNVSLGGYVSASFRNIQPTAIPPSVSFLPMIGALGALMLRKRKKVQHSSMI